MTQRLLQTTLLTRKDIVQGGEKVMTILWNFALIPTIIVVGIVRNTRIVAMDTITISLMKNMYFLEKMTNGQGT